MSFDKVFWIVILFILTQLFHVKVFDGWKLPASIIIFTIKN